MRSVAARYVVLLALALAIAGRATSGSAQGMAPGVRYFMPDAAASKLVTVTVSGRAARNVTVLTEAVAIKETGPPQTVARFGEMYSFSPTFFAVHRGEPARIRFWNLQPDDAHDLMLLDSAGDVLMHQPLPPLSMTAWVFTFHREGLYDFRCAVHQPEMSGQILVLPPARRR